ncbi:YaaA family protein [Fusobacterium sp.]|uniref:YaaA family protein n=1 Tax=Fusobacterium sp. TaxID=68766 RepID=UPI002620EFD7|nr:YaaA family protein [Fusobacterium sp.]
MKIVFSPSKTMKFKEINFSSSKEIRFLDKTDILVKRLKEFSIEEIGKLFKLKGELLEKTYENIRDFSSLESSEALSLYDGVTFRQLETDRYTENNIDYLNENLFIFSALYGVLSPNTKIKPYRLDMTISFLDESLYKFWQEDINNYLEKYRDEVFINLASKEFSKLLDYKKFKVVDVEFRQNVNGTLKNISTEGKKARGMLLNYMTINNILDVEKIKEFSEEGYRYSEENSSEKKIFFIKD